MSVTLITVLHDSTGMQIPLFEELACQIKAIYDECYITLSDQTTHWWAEVCPVLGPKRSGGWVGFGCAT